eukprot:8205319-Pyramimonas_sp.AAC.1
MLRVGMGERHDHGEQERGERASLADSCLLLSRGRCLPSVSHSEATLGVDRAHGPQHLVRHPVAAQSL